MFVIVSATKQSAHSQPFAGNIMQRTYICMKIRYIHIIYGFSTIHHGIWYHIFRPFATSTEIPITFKGGSKSALLIYGQHLHGIRAVNW